MLCFRYWLTKLFYCIFFIYLENTLFRKYFLTPGNNFYTEKLNLFSKWCVEISHIVLAFCFPEENQCNSSCTWKDYLLKCLFSFSALQYYASKKKGQIQIWITDSSETQSITTHCDDIYAVRVLYDDSKSNKINLQT